MLNLKDTNTKGNGSGHNVIAFGTKIEGNISIESDIRIDGELKGDISGTGKVIIGETGCVYGDIRCPNIDVIGKVIGNIYAENIVSLKSTASIEGNIATKVISVEPQAEIIGNFSVKRE